MIGIRHRPERRSVIVLGGMPPTTDIAFLWSSVSTAGSYVLQVGSTAGASDVYNSDVGNQLTATLPLAAGTYWSRVVPSTTAEQTFTVT